jgi:hypothetical protein
MARLQKSEGKHGEHFKTFQRVLLSVCARERKKIQHPIENAF